MTKNKPRVLRITASDLDAGNFYTGTYETDADGFFDGSIEIDAGLGCVCFKGGVYARGLISAKAGSGIIAGEGLKAGEGIKAGWGIEAGSGIKAGEGIEAGRDIVASWGIEAGLSIVAKRVSSGLRIFAGLCLWKMPEPAEMEVRAELRAGVIAFGTHVPPDTEGQ